MYLIEKYISDKLTDDIKFTIDELVKTCSEPSWYKSTINGKDYAMIEKKDDLKNIIKIYERLLNKKLDLKNAWTVYGQEGTYHTIHRHASTDKFICTVLFLDTSGVSTPNGDFYAVLNNTVYQYSPRKGDLLIFSSDVCHGTYPQVKGLRHTLNLDFIPL
jgi:mRNA degradation ribonuclease J1/J2